MSNSPIAMPFSSHLRSASPVNITGLRDSRSPSAQGPQPVRELARRIDLTSGSMTTAIVRLETRHLVTRADHATDRRAWVIHLTPKGDALITKVVAGHQDALKRAIRRLSKAELATLTDLLKRLGTTAEAQLTQEEGGTP